MGQLNFNKRIFLVICGIISPKSEPRYWRTALCNLKLKLKLLSSSHFSAKYFPFFLPNFPIFCAKYFQFFCQRFPIFCQIFLFFCQIFPLFCQIFPIFLPNISRKILFPLSVFFPQLPLFKESITSLLIH